MQLMLCVAMWTLIIGIVIAFVVAAVYWLSAWCDGIEYAKMVSGTGNYIRIRFKEFIHFYAVVPDNFNLHRDYCLCYFECGYKHKIYCITFSFLDFVRYRIWCKRLTTLNKRKREMDIKTDFCKDMRKAIFETNKDIEKEIEDCARQLRDIAKKNF